MACVFWGRWRGGGDVSSVYVYTHIIICKCAFVLVFPFLSIYASFACHCAGNILLLIYHIAWSNTISVRLNATRKSMCKPRELQLSFCPRVAYSHLRKSRAIDNCVHMLCCAELACLCLCLCVNAIRTTKRRHSAAACLLLYTASHLVLFNGTQAIVNAQPAQLFRTHTRTSFVKHFSKLQYRSLCISHTCTNTMSCAW